MGGQSIRKWAWELNLECCLELYEDPTMECLYVLCRLSCTIVTNEYDNTFLNCGKVQTILFVPYICKKNTKNNLQILKSIHFVKTLRNSNSNKGYGEFEKRPLLCCSITHTRDHFDTTAVKPEIN